MSTERDETTPIPAQPGGPAGDQPTTPIRRPGPGRTEEPTLVFDTFAAAAEPTRPTASTPDPGPDATRPLPATPGVTPRSSAFAAAGGSGGASGGGSVGGSGGGSGGVGPGAGPGPEPGRPGAPAPTVDAAPAPDPARVPDRAASPDPGVSTSLRVGTVVWGLVLAIIGAGVVAVAAGATVDLELALIGLLALAGVALVVGSVVSASRHRR